MSSNLSTPSRQCALAAMVVTDAATTELTVTNIVGDHSQTGPWASQGHRPIAAIANSPSSRPSHIGSTNIVTPSTPVLASGITVAGRYIIKRILGQGGFGFSYLVEDTQRFGELCVLKELRPVQQEEKFLKKAIELFKREAKALHRIDHPQIPKFMACFTQAKRLFIVQEYINGITYLKLLQHRKKQSKLFTEAEIVLWLAHMLRVLDYLHSRNIMHRDISPENVMYCRDRRLPMLIDFGLVNNPLPNDQAENSFQKDNPYEDPSENSHKAFTTVGKFGYSPPEQMLGKCTPASDLYALGVTALVLLTGKHPRYLIDPHTLDLNWQPHAQISAPLAKILTTLTRQQPQERFQSAKAVFEQLRQLLPDELRKTLSQVPPQAISMASLDQPQSLPRLDPDFITQCRHELLRCIGPIADIVIEETLEENPTATPQEIAQILAGQISNADQAIAFLSHICIPDEATVTRETMPEVDTAIQHHQHMHQPTLQPAFVDQCRQTLAWCMGPMASVIVEDTLAEYPHVNAPAFVNRLAKEIPNGPKAQEFRQLMRNAIIRDRH